MAFLAFLPQLSLSATRQAGEQLLTPRHLSPILRHMSPRATAAVLPPAPEPTLIERTAHLMGGRRILRRALSTPLDVHDVMEAGLPGAALHHLIDSLTLLDIDAALEKAVGLSRRTFQRSKETPTKLLSAEQSGRVWKFAEVLAKATVLLGSQASAERWLDSPALGLGRRRPLELMTTPAGLEIVETYLGRLEYGVYT
jgi:putative toxin-antitoxin system antitoxin component (TIGR02293 family)